MLHRHVVFRHGGGSDAAAASSRDLGKGKIFGERIGPRRLAKAPGVSRSLSLNLSNFMHFHAHAPRSGLSAGFRVGNFRRIGAAALEDSFF